MTTKTPLLPSEAKVVESRFINPRPPLPALLFLLVT